MPGIGTPTGWVIATTNAGAAGALWRDGLGFAESATEAPGLPAWEHPESGQRVTVAEFPAPDPPMALGVRCEDIESSLQAATSAGLTEYWRSTSAEGTQFVMCQGEPGVFVLLYQRS